MAKPVSFGQQVRTNLQKVQSSAEFGGNKLWLTFYLCGPPGKLQEVSETLNARGWVNVEGWEGAFLYPKVQVKKSAEGVLRTAEAAQDLCAAPQVTVMAVPEAAVDEDRGLEASEYQIRFAREPRVVEPIAPAKRMQSPPDKHLRLCILRPDRSHIATARFRDWRTSEDALVEDWGMQSFGLNTPLSQQDQTQLSQSRREEIRTPFHITPVVA